MLGVASIAHAEVDGIRDNGAFFSARAKTEALGGISDIGKRFRKDLVYETYSAIPQELKQGLDLADKAAMGRFYEEWAVKQAKQQRVNGIYILLVKEPPHLQILVGNDTQRNAFSLKNRDELRSLMLPKLHNKQYDEALLESVNFVSATLREHAPARGRTPVMGHRTEAPSSSHWLIMALLIGGAVWVVLRIVRAVAGGGGGGYSGTAMAPGGGGGGFMSNMLGGMFGAAAGMWIYDQFSGRSSSWGGGDTGYGGDNGGNGDNGYSGQDSDYSGSGGDFGDNDSGGGDSGGGDFGGGGDF
jgi:hypothetical protein